jgi:outer membrane protein TolC
MMRGYAGLSVLALALLTGCADTQYGSDAFDAQRMPGTAKVAEQTQYRDYHFIRPTSAYQEAVDARIAALSAAPMTEATVVEMALLQNDGVQDLMQEYWVLRPGFVTSVAETTGNGEDTRTVEAKVLGELISRSTTQRWEREFGAEYLGAAEMLLDAAAEARTAYYEAVAAAQLASMFDRALEAETAAAELANEQYRAGTTSRLDQAQQHLAYAGTYKEAAEARQEAVAAREALNRQLELWGAQTAWVLPDRLPDLPAARPALGDVEAYAISQSPAAYGARASTEQRETGAVLRSEVREAYHRMLTNYDIAKYQRDVVVPLTSAVLGEVQLNYNAMLDDVYGLLEATREQIEAGSDYVTTLAAFWAAHAELTRRLGGQLPPPASETATTPTPPAEGTT